VGAGGERLSDEAMARRLFEKECDNFQAEELLIIQLCALHVRRLAVAAAVKPSPGAGDASQDLAAKRPAEAAAALGRLDSQVAAMLPSAQTTSWAGGVTSRLDIFLQTYRLALACYAWGVGAESEEVARLKDLAASLEALEAHPLLVHALSLMLQSPPSGCDRLASEQGLPLLWLTSSTA
jgi:hypothetical protein